LPADTVAVAAILLSGLLHGAQVRFGARAQNAVVVIKLALLGGFFVIAAATVSGGRWQAGALPDAPVGAWAVFTTMAVSLVWISLSYSGFNAAVYVAEEATDTRVTVPAALLYGTLIVFALYVGLNAIFVFAPPAELVAGQPDVAAVAARWLAGERVAALVRAIIALALFSSVSSMLMAAPRVYAKMADDGLLPAFLRFSGETPRAAVIAQTAISVLLVFASTLQNLLSYLGLTLSLSAAVTVGCLFLPGTREQPLWSRASVVPLLYVAATLLFGGVMGWQNPLQVIAAAGTFGAGALAYLLTRRRAAAPVA
jgi:APA family basic amino acid/polyamine antiporter